jgi:hypothetical protein
VYQATKSPDDIVIIRDARSDLRDRGEEDGNEITAYKTGVAVELLRRSKRSWYDWAGHRRVMDVEGGR